MTTLALSTHPTHPHHSSGSVNFNLIFHAVGAIVLMLAMIGCVWYSNKWTQAEQETTRVKEKVRTAFSQYVNLLDQASNEKDEILSLAGMALVIEDPSLCDQQMAAEFRKRLTEALNPPETMPKESTTDDPTTN